MSGKDNPTLERLLSRIGSEPVPADPKHFYALRRALLNSAYFERHRAAEAVASWVEGASTALAGAVLAAAFVLVVRGAVLQRPVLAQAAPSSQVERVGKGVAWQVPDAVKSMAGRITLSVAR